MRAADSSRNALPVCCGDAMKARLADAQTRSGQTIFVTVWWCPSCGRVARPKQRFTRVSSPAPAAGSSAQPTGPGPSPQKPDPPAPATLQKEIAGPQPSRNAALKLIAERIRNLTRATGVAIAIDDGEGIVCCASTGSAPEVGARLNPDSGLSGECVRTGVVVCCEDTELDPRVDREACRQLNIRSAVMVPLFATAGDKVAGLLEVFSASHQAFNGQDVLTLRRSAELITAAIAAAAKPVPQEEALVEARRSPPAAAAVVPQPASVGCHACGHPNPANAGDCECCHKPLRAASDSNITTVDDLAEGASVSGG